MMGIFYLFIFCLVVGVLLAPFAEETKNTYREEQIDPMAFYYEDGEDG